MERIVGAESSAAIASALGHIVTLKMLPETKGKSLDEIESETGTPAEKMAAWQPVASEWS
jgi:hypothetical protein